MVVAFIIFASRTAKKISYVFWDVTKCGEENCVVLGYYAACSGNFLQTFQDNLSVSSFKVKNPRNNVVSP